MGLVREPGECFLTSAKRYFGSEYTITAAESTAEVMLICYDFRSLMLVRYTDDDNLLLFMPKPMS